MVHENDQHNDNDDSDTSVDAHSCREVDHVDVDHECSNNTTPSSSSGSDDNDGSVLTPIFPSDPSGGMEDHDDSRGDDDADDENNDGEDV